MKLTLQQEKIIKAISETTPYSENALVSVFEKVKSFDWLIASTQLADFYCVDLHKAVAILESAYQRDTEEQS